MLMVRKSTGPVKRFVAAGFQETDEIILSRGLDDEIEVQGGAGEPIGDEGDSTDHRELDSLPFKEA